jgi:hypothetical protein
MNHPIRRLVTLLGLALVLACPRPGLARDPQRTRFGEDTHVFRRILFDFKLTALKDVRELDADPADTVLVVLGDTAFISRQGRGWLRLFVARGGALLLATDRVPGEKAERDLVERELIEVAGVTVSGVSVRCWDSGACYRRAGVALDYCPLLRPVPRAQPALFRDPRKGENAALEVATNAPSFLQRARALPGQLEMLANLPSRWWRPEFPDRYVISGLPFAVGGESGPGKVLVLADHSIFINEMMLPPDNGNVEFTYNCLDWLRAKPNGWKRHKVLFVEDGRVRTDFNVPVKNVPINPAELPGLLYANRNELAAGVEQELARLENRNALDEGLLDFLSDQGLTADRLERIAVVVLSVLLVGYAGFRLLTRGRHRAEPAVLPLARAVALHVPTAPLLEQRHQALLRGGNVWEAARGLARQWFAAAGATPGQGPPRVAVEGGWWERWALRRRVLRLWRLAYGPRPVRVSLRALRRLLGELEELSVSLANGSLRVEA